RVFDDALLVDAKLAPQRLVERYRLRRDDMHQRTTLKTGKYRRIDELFVLRVRQNDASARASQRLMRRARDEARGAYSAGIQVRGDEPRVMRHVDHKICANRVRDRPKSRPVDHS